MSLKNTDLENNLGLSNQNNLNQKDRLIYFARVVSIDDPMDGGRIKVRIKGIDDKVPDNELVYCSPFIPKFYFNLPKVGETVKIILFNRDNPFIFREWIGPVISQPQKLEKDDFYFTSRSTMDNSLVTPEVAPSTVPNAIGIYPKKEDISIQGRNNTDIILRNDLSNLPEILIRSNKFDINNKLSLNRKNLSYIQLKSFKTISNDGKGFKIDNNNNPILTTRTNIISDKINLISHNGEPTPPSIIKTNVGNDGNGFTEKDIEDFEKQLESLVKGNKLVTFLKLIQNYVSSHIHTGDRLPANPGAGSVDDIKKFDLDSLLSKNIKIN